MTVRCASDLRHESQVRQAGPNVVKMATLQQDVVLLKISKSSSASLCLVRSHPDPSKEKPRSATEEESVTRVNKVEVPDNNAGLPEGLVGPLFIHTINGHDVDRHALIDSGPNVTIIFTNSYNQHLAKVPKCRHRVSL